MKIKSTLLFSGLLLSGLAKAQDMNGFRTDNYNGVNGAFFNPANLGDSRFKVDVNLFGMSLYAGNKNTDFNFKTFSEIGDDTGSLNSLVGVNNVNSIMANFAFHLPSVSYRINEKTTVAILSRARVLFNVNDIDGKLLSSINGDVSSAGNSFSIANTTNMRINATAFAEFGVSAGRVVYDKGHHFLKVGATVKYLGGIGNSYLQLNNFKTTINSDSNGENTYATNTSGSVALGVGGINVNNFDDVKLEFQASGLGADLGAVYEYRPDNLSDENNKYLFKVSAAVLDLGSVKYTATPQYSMGYDINIPAGQQFFVDTLSGKDITEIGKVLDAYPQYFKRTSGLNNANYRVALPRTLQIGADFRAMKNIYIAANAQIAMVNNETKAYNPNSLNSITITPRFEMKWVAAYIPIHYNNLAKAAVGFGFRLGPLYAGSSSILSMAFAKSKQADAYFGFRVGIKSKKKSS